MAFICFQALRLWHVYSLLIEIECKYCKTHFYMCRACYRGHVYCSSKCRGKAYVIAHRKSQSKYRTSDAGREKNRINAQNRRRIDKKQKHKKIVADESTFSSSFRVILYPKASKTAPRCCFCGVFGKIVKLYMCLRTGFNRSGITPV